jgi:hypothetical protein
MELSFPQAFLLTLALETAVLFVLLRRRYGAKEIAVNSAMANTMTHPLVWFLFPMMGLGYAVQAGASELFACCAEALLFGRMFPGMGLKEAAIISIAANAASFGAGMLALAL